MDQNLPTTHEKFDEKIKFSLEDLIKNLYTFKSLWF